MTHEQAIDFWYGLVNYEKQPPLPDDLKLDRMRALMDQLGNPQDRLRIVHVAGSKGKGSTSAMLAAVLREAGYATGLFTSPHLCRVEERIQIDGVAICQADLTELLCEIRALVEMTDAARPTFFEVATAMAFTHFARRKVDVAVMEVGLGGRFDSTNICVPLVSVITSISFDHTEQLGNRLASIAMEKAGIVKRGRPVVSGVTEPEARTVIEAICRERHAPLVQLNNQFSFIHEPGQVVADADEMWKKPHVRITTTRRRWPRMELGLLGQHQAANAAVAVATVEELQTFAMRISDAAVGRGLGNVHWPARMEVIGVRPLVVLDCAHNVASIQAFLDTLMTSFPSTPRKLIFAVSVDKDIAGMLHLLMPHFDHIYLTRTSNRRSADPGDLAALITGQNGPRCTICETPDEAWRAALAAARPDELVCITGSVFLAGEIRGRVPGCPVA